MAGSKNLGQVAGMSVGTIPPVNIKMIWWDSTSSQQCHKIYDYNLKQWVILNQGILSTITYVELRNIALTVGLSLGKFYVISDRGNVLALSITRTKVQYVDISGNLLVDDLGSNIQYYISSNNLTIDGETGIFNQESTKLNFNFTEATPVFETAYIYGKDRTNPSSSVMRLIKFKLSSLISTVTGNALTWNSGLYFNFNQTLLDLGDKKGGVVLFDTYTKEQEVQEQSIENIANNYNTLVSQVNALVTSATSDVNIMSKKITTLQTGGEPIDAAAGDTLYVVLSKFQRYINKFKIATGIYLSKNFSFIGFDGKVNNNDTVEIAIAKLQNQNNKIKFNLPDTWVAASEPHQNISAGDTFDDAFSKIEADRKIMNSLENDITDVLLKGVYNSQGVDTTIKFRIVNGMLEIFLNNYIPVEWIYSRTTENDYTRFFPINFNDDIFNKISKYFYGLSTYTEDWNNAKPVMPLVSISMARGTTAVSSGEWVSPDRDVKALLSLGYATIYDSESGKYKKAIGLVLSPISVFYILNDVLTCTEVKEDTTFQDISGMVSVRYYLPKMVIRYKLW